jgi:hypothetical protein
MVMTRIRVTIDHVALGGMDAATRAAFVHGLKMELAAQLTGRVSHSRSQRTPVVRLGQVTVESGPAGGRTLGAHVARAVGGRLGR